MISKERLQELIDKKEKIYYMQQNDINGVWILLENVSIEENSYKELVLRNNGIGWCLGCSQSYPINSLPLQYLYETKEDAEFAKEFKNITREEVLNLPTWEIFIQLGIPFEFTNKNGEWFCLEICDIAGIDKIVIYHKIGFSSNIFSAPATKENYMEACRIAKNLFLGVDKND